MNLLLDTRVFLWWIAGESLPAPVDDAIRNPDHTVWLSAVSVGNHHQGQVAPAGSAARFIEEQRKVNAFNWLPIEPAALDILQDLPFPPRPFRLLADRTGHFSGAHADQRRSGLCRLPRPTTVVVTGTDALAVRASKRLRLEESSQEFEAE